MHLRGNDLYDNGLGGALTFSLTQGQFGLDFLISSYDMPARSALSANYTDGSGRLTGLMLRYHLRGLPLSFAGGLGVASTPVLVPPSADDVLVGNDRIKNGALLQLGPIISARLELKRTPRGILYLDLRALVPGVSELPPAHYEATGASTTTGGATATPIRVSATLEPGVSTTLGLGFQMWFGRD